MSVDTEKARYISGKARKWGGDTITGMAGLQLLELADEVDRLQAFRDEVDERTKRIDEKVSRTKENFEALVTRKLELDVELEQLRTKHEALLEAAKGIYSDSHHKYERLYEAIAACGDDDEPTAKRFESFRDPKTGLRRLRPPRGG